MKLRRCVVAGAAGVAAVALVAAPAGAETGADLRAGDVVCTDQARSETGVFFSGALINGTGAFSVRVAATVGGSETEIWRRQGTDLSVSEIVNTPTSGQFLRGCVSITRSTASTSFRHTFFVLGPDAQLGFGPHKASLSPGASACGDNVIGRARVVGTASAPVRWSLSGRDTEFNPIGEIFSRSGATIDELFTPGAGIGAQELCVTNTSRRRVTVGFEMTPA